MQMFLDVYFNYLVDTQLFKHNLVHLQIKSFPISHTFQANAAHDGR